MYDARKLYLTDSGGVEMPIKSDVSPGKKTQQQHPPSQKKMKPKVTKGVVHFPQNIGQEYCNDGPINVEIPTDNFNVTSPLFDDGIYPTNLNCTWKLIAEGTTSSDYVAFKIVFDHLEVCDSINEFEITVDYTVLIMEV